MKESKIKRCFAALGNYFKKLGLSFIDSFRYNPAKMAMLVLLIPTILLGFCLIFHFNATKFFVTYNETIQLIRLQRGEITVPASFIPTNAANILTEYARSIAVNSYAGFQLFALMVLGAVMMFVAVNVSSKRSLGSCIQATIVTAGIILFGVFWIMNFIRTDYIYNIAKYTTLQEGAVYSIFSKDNIISITCVILSMATAVIGTILAYIFRDKTYKKDKS